MKMPKPKLNNFSKPKDPLNSNKNILHPPSIPPPSMIDAKTQLKKGKNKH